MSAGHHHEHGPAHSKGAESFDRAFAIGIGLNLAFVAALRSSSVESRFATLMAAPAPSTPQQFDEFLRRERAKYQAIVKLSGAKLE